MGGKLYLSQIRDLKKTRPAKLTAREIQRKNKEAFDKSYFGKLKKAGYRWWVNEEYK